MTSADTQYPSSLKEFIRAEALRLGFDLCGVTTPEPPAHYPVFERWLTAGRHGEMGYLATERARQRRADPREILNECRSILILGARYARPADSLAGHHGRVASYAWGDDYHDILPEKLKALVAAIETHLERTIPNRWYTDTGPVLERDLAQRAGLGWIGKNTCLINPQQGSYFLLAEILLGIELEPDLPFVADRCGSCTRCLEACPTNCILPDRTLDASRCISYLTIELKGPIPKDLRPDLENWVFGCDICQQACPWNQRFAREDNGTFFKTRPDLPAPVLLEELQLSAQEFNRKYKGSPIRRARRRGYLRNVIVALGNLAAGTGDAGATAALGRALSGDPEPLVRAHAAWALGQVGGAAAKQALEAALQSESDPGVLEEIWDALIDCANRVASE